MMWNLRASVSRVSSYRWLSERLSGWTPHVAPNHLIPATPGVSLPHRGITEIRLPAASALLPIALLFLTILVYAVARRILFHIAYTSPDTEAFAFIAITCIAACFATAIRYSTVPWLLRVILRGIGVVVLVQVLFDGFGAIPPPPNILFGADAPHELFFRYTALLGVVAGMASLWRPAFLLPLFFYYVTFRIRIVTLDGIAVVDTDYLNLLDTGSFAVWGTLVTFFLTSEWAQQKLPLLRRALANIDRQQLRESATSLVWAVLVGAHLGNYFHSALAKIEAGGPAPWTWLLRNPTNTSIIIGLDRGINPLAQSPWLVQHAWDAIREGTLPFNTFVLGVQLLSVVACIRVRTLALITLLFDMFHVGVYLTLGALFHFWIVMNLLVYTSAWRLPEKQFTPLMKICCIATVLFGSVLFYTNYLGWLDGGKLVSTRFFAETRDGREVWIPSAYFGIYSYNIAQGKMYIPDNHFRYRIGGNNHNLANWNDATSCGPEIVLHQNVGVGLPDVQSAVRRTDSFMRAYPYIKNDNLYYLYPHHMQPNPFVFREFNRLKIDDIVGYKYVTDSVCLSVANGRLVRDVRKRDEFEIPVK